MAEVESSPVAATVETDEIDFTLKKKKSSKSKPSFATETTEDSVDEVSDLMAELGKKKKKKEKKEKATEDGEDGTPAEDDGDNDGDASFDFKKKKKKKKAVAVVDEFEQQLQEAGLTGDGAQTTATTTIAEESTGPSEATEILTEVTYNVNGEPDFTYPQLLTRFFRLLRENNPDLAAGSGTKYKIPPPSVMREGNKKTLFINVKEISDRMHRPMDHVIQFLFAELGTSGSVDGNSRLVIKGRFQQKQLETVLRRYILEYVTCKLCKSVNTTLSKENRLYFLNCNSCGSRRSVTSIKTGYQAITSRSRRR